MPPIKLPYLEITFARGRPYYYYRRGGRRHTLPGDPSRPEFLAAYNALHAEYHAALQGGGTMLQPESIAAIIRDYRDSPDFKNLSASSKTNYRMYLDRIQEKFGPHAARAFTRRVALKWRDSMAGNPSVANHAMAVLRKLMSFALDRGHIDFNPVLNPKKMKVGTYEPWPADELEKFRAQAPAHMLLALTLGLYTGQRRGDVVRLTWTQVKNGGIELVQEKTGARLWIPMHRHLQVAIAKAEENKTAVTVLTNVKGISWDANEFSKRFREACTAARISGKYNFHGLRKNATIALLEAGCTTAQVKAITGHATDEMVNHYGAQVNQKKLGQQAIRKWQRSKN